MSDWQTIDSAPRDGTDVLCWSSVYGAPVIARGDTNGAFWEDDWSFDVAATHWMPLPKAPETAA